MIVIAFALALGLVGGWVYAGYPRPRKPVAARKPVGDGPVSPAPAPGASTARP
jgi:hypothetical protein